MHARLKNCGSEVISSVSAVGAAATKSDDAPYYLAYLLLDGKEVYACVSEPLGNNVPYINIT